MAFSLGRVNLIGEHTDYSGGLFMPVAIDRYTVVAAAPARDASVSVLHALDVGETAMIDMRSTLRVGPASRAGLSEIRRGHWLSYVAGVIEGARAFGAIDRNLDLVITSSLPMGGGVSSSAALECAVASLMDRVFELDLSGGDLADIGRQAEHKFAGVPCGIMDQMACISGIDDGALLIDSRAMQMTMMPFPDASQAELLVINTRVRHELASGEYAKRRQACERAARVLGLRELRDASMDSVIDHRLPEDLKPIVRHVVTENDRVVAAGRALWDNDLKRLGELLNASHASLRDDYRVSCAELDAAVDAACGAPGAFGARLTGGGFGGCVIALVAPDARVRVQAAVEQAFASRGWPAPEFFVVRAVGGARELGVSEIAH